MFPHRRPQRRKRRRVVFFNMAMPKCICIIAASDFLVEATWGAYFPYLTLDVCIEHRSDRMDHMAQHRPSNRLPAPHLEIRHIFRWVGSDLGDPRPEFRELDQLARPVVRSYPAVTEYVATRTPDEWVLSVLMREKQLANPPVVEYPSPPRKPLSKNINVNKERAIFGHFDTFSASLKPAPKAAQTETQRCQARATPAGSTPSAYDIPTQAGTLAFGYWAHAIVEQRRALRHVPKRHPPPAYPERHGES